MLQIGNPGERLVFELAGKLSKQQCSNWLSVKIVGFETLSQVQAEFAEHLRILLRPWGPPKLLELRNCPTHHHPVPTDLLLACLHRSTVT